MSLEVGKELIVLSRAVESFRILLRCHLQNILTLYSPVVALLTKENSFKCLLTSNVMHRNLFQIDHYTILTCLIINVNRFGFKLAPISLAALEENYFIFFYDNIHLFKRTTKLNLGAVRLFICWRCQAMGLGLKI